MKAIFVTLDGCSKMEDIDEPKPYLRKVIHSRMWDGMFEDKDLELRPGDAITYRLYKLSNRFVHFGNMPTTAFLLYEEVK